MKGDAAHEEKKNNEANDRILKERLFLCAVQSLEEGRDIIAGMDNTGPSTIA